jgi:hypothetical protein
MSDPGRKPFEFGKADALRLHALLREAESCFKMADQLMSVTIETIVAPDNVDRVLEAARLLCQLGAGFLQEAFMLLPQEPLDLPF